ncbi:hypothetical protein XS16_001811 [Salmonella enterica subsp. enterica serovar Newport]|nr:hypothetical protein [Salmonella enterica]ECI2306484.1 hypothetical protein [Salmonella enterica subsp. enterica serovar Infantis]EDT3085483.1 hypothetical protein [Salmonella enterica subsp. enterica serovar Newport]EGI5077997.1 hypothetical protein [Salmonella enterica subsp. enterica serovar Infantis]
MMNKPLKRAVFVFVLICVIGTFCALAGGVKWGTFDAGMSALFTLFPAALVAGAVYAGSL